MDKETRLKDVVCPQYGANFVLTWVGYKGNPETLVLRGCPSGGIYDVRVRCPYCTYKEGKFRGCAVGCAIHSLGYIEGNEYDMEDNTMYESHFGIPEILGDLQDVIHEGLSDESFPTWPERFMEAVPTKTDLSLVFPRFALWFLVDEENGILREAQFLRHREAIQNAAGLFSAITAKEQIPRQVWQDCAEFAYDVENMERAGGDSGRSSRAACAIILSYITAYAARIRIEKALDTVARLRSRVCFSETSEYYEKCADRLIELLKAEGNV